MGWNTAVVILNDAIGEIESHPEEFVRNLLQAIGKNTISHKSEDIPVGNHANAAAVFHQAHADSTGVYAIGGNHASNLMEVYNGGKHHYDEDKIKLLQQLAEKMGFNLTPKTPTSKPGISTDEVIKSKACQIPAEVFAAFDELIAKNFNGHYSTILQDDVLLLALKKLRGAGRRLTRQKIFDNHWLDVEGVYRAKGWSVEYDKPGYNETYPATFKFKKK